MRKQTKLVAVLSTAALLALGASMSSFAAVGWAEENGTWVYYDKNEEAVTETWAKSGDNWFYLNDDGEMATDAIVEYKDNYYYVDVNGAMVANTWVSVENEDYDGEDEPITLWYYFGANGKAYKGNSDKANFKTINGKRYTFDEEGRMQYGWIKDGKRDSSDTAWQEADYYCGDENDGAQAVGWRFLEIIDTDYDDNDGIRLSSSNVFDDEDQTRWFYFKANGKKVYAKDGETINGSKYSFDEFGRMNAEWINVTTSPSSASEAKNYTGWRYFKSPEDGSRATKGWFKVVPDEVIDTENYDDDEESWFYADGKGALITDKIKEINGKRYLFDAKGRMKSGFRLVFLNGSVSDVEDIQALDSKKEFNGERKVVDTEEDFLANINTWLEADYRLYNFGGSDDGAMKTGKQTLSLDGENFTFLFGKSGSNRGAGQNKVDSGKIYQGGMLLKASKDDKYVVVEVDKTGTEDRYTLLDTNDFLTTLCDPVASADLKTTEEKAWEPKTVTGIEYKLINTSGAIQSGKTSAKDGDDNVFVQNKENITRIYIKK